MHPGAATDNLAVRSDSDGSPRSTSPMRNNQPVTQLEHTYDAHTTLMSSTDAKGRITYANQAFVDISGFERDALMGWLTTSFVTPTCRRLRLPTCGSRSRRESPGRASSKSPRQWGPLLGARQRGTHPSARPGGRLHFGANPAHAAGSAAGRSAVCRYAQAAPTICVCTGHFAAQGLGLSVNRAQGGRSVGIRAAFGLSAMLGLAGLRAAACP